MMAAKVSVLTNGGWQVKWFEFEDEAVLDRHIERYYRGKMVQVQHLSSEGVKVAKVALNAEFKAIR